MVLAPARVTLVDSDERATTSRAVSIKCGNYHTMVLCADGSVSDKRRCKIIIMLAQLYTFGSNCHGQLGVGDIKRRVGPQKVGMPLACKIAQVTFVLKKLENDEMPMIRLLLALITP